MPTYDGINDRRLQRRHRRVVRCTLNVAAAAGRRSSRRGVGGCFHRAGRAVLKSTIADNPRRHSERVYSQPLAACATSTTSPLPLPHLYTLPSGVTMATPAGQWL